MRRLWRKSLRAYPYVLPAMAIMLLISFYPLLFGIGLSFHNMSWTTMGNRTVRFVGLANFARMLGSLSAEFYLVTGRTVLWTVVNVFFHVTIGLALALVLNQPRLRLRGIYRTLLVIPWAMPQYLSALIWKTMYNYDYGAINRIIQAIGLSPIPWLHDAGWAFVAVVMANVWAGFSFMMVVASGALQSIPAELYEAADVDGASWWAKLTRITLPLLRPAMVPAIVLGVIWTFNQFNFIYLITEGGPHRATETVLPYIYKRFLGGMYSYTAAFAMMVFLILLTVNIINLRITRAAEGAF